MEKKLAKHKMIRRKYRHVAAALAGVAIMAGTVLHGNTAEAADKPIIPPVAVEQTAPVDKNATELNTTNKNKDRDRKDKPDQKHDRYDHKQYEHERWADRGQSFGQRMHWYNDSLNKVQIYFNNATPIDIVMAAADNLGFDVDNDTFTLLRQSSSQSIVRVVHNGINYDITVDHLSNGNWQLTLVDEVQ